jgi:hypothetical protein
MDRVTEVIEKNKNWSIKVISENGYSMRSGSPRFRARNVLTGEYYDDDTFIVGVKSMKVYLGKYTIPVRCDVTVFYGFDEDLKLIDIAIVKVFDTLNHSTN